MRPVLYGRPLSLYSGRRVSASATALLLWTLSGVVARRRTITRTQQTKDVADISSAQLGAHHTIGPAQHIQQQQFGQHQQTGRNMSKVISVYRPLM